MRGKALNKSPDVGQLVTAHVRLELGEPEGEPSAMDSDLTYDPADPYALTMIFKTGTVPVRWTFGRDLLLNGIYEPTGEGDVHVWPCLGSDGSAVVIFELNSPDGDVFVQASSRDVSQFVNAMLVSVPEGTEGNHVDLDAELSGFFSA